MLSNVLFRGLEKLRQLILVQPDRFLFQLHANLRKAVLALVDQ
jgi:hypothetical protein